VGTKIWKNGSAATVGFYRAIKDEKSQLRRVVQGVGEIVFRAD
jgi:hypothetical protein